MADDSTTDTRLTVAEIEALLNKENSWDNDQVIRIMPNGEIRYVNNDTPRILTLRENLGGEYASAESES